MCVPHGMFAISVLCERSQACRTPPKQDSRGRVLMRTLFWPNDAHLRIRRATCSTRGMPKSSKCTLFRGMLISCPECRSDSESQTRKLCKTGRSPTSQSPRHTVRNSTIKVQTSRWCDRINSSRKLTFIKASASVLRLPSSFHTTSPLKAIRHLSAITTPSQP